MAGKAESGSQNSELEARQLGIRLSGKLHAEVVAYQEKVQQEVPTGITITISDAIRALIELGLKEVESKEHSNR